jgi:hypothetical protein
MSFVRRSATSLIPLLALPIMILTGAPPARAAEPAREDAIAPATAPARAAVAPAPARPDAIDFARCPAASDVALLTIPRVPRAGAPLRIVAASARPLDAALIVQRAGGATVARSAERRGANPSWWTAEVASADAGTYRVGLGRGGEVAACATVVVGERGPASRRARPAGAVWPVERAWGPDTEALYSAWVEHLFDDPLDADPSWRGLGTVLGDPSRNLLHDHLGLGEDSGGKMVLNPDCADLPFFLRAYFAWKLGLPFGYSACSRGTATGPPRCSGWRSNLSPETPPSADDVTAFLTFARRDVGWGVHSGSARTPAAADATDLYPTRVSPETITPGTVFADPYGHTLVVVARVPQTKDGGGLLLAVDAQPDLTVARKRFWRGNFLFSTDPKLGGAGFKHFRPIVLDGNKLRPLTNDEIEQHPDYGDFSLEQYADGVEGFYDAMDAMLSPEPLDPERAYRQMIDALDEQIRARVRSVQNGEDWVAKNRRTIPMPEGAAIFETSGPWEDYATPSRDLRLLIAIDVVQGFPAKVEQQPERYALPPNASPRDVRRALERLLDEEAQRRRFTYVKSDRSMQELTLADVLARATALEMAYNPNDCVETRWGAAKGSAEAASCKRVAPPEQRARMERYREWFAERRRPPRA